VTWDAKSGNESVHISLRSSDGRPEKGVKEDSIGFFTVEEEGRLMEVRWLPVDEASLNAARASPAALRDPALYL
jgi:hypothetical protein